GGRRAGDPVGRVRTEPGGGWGVLGRAGIALVVVEVASTALAPPPAGRQRRRRPPLRRPTPAAIGTSALEREARDQRGELGGVEAVEEPFAQGLGNREIGLDVELREQRAPLGERPVADVPPRLEHT